nr:hypothetical protein [Croceicoccus bisphenolivorans]
MAVSDTARELIQALEDEPPQAGTQGMPRQVLATFAKLVRVMRCSTRMVGFIDNEIIVLDVHHARSKVRSQTRKCPSKAITRSIPCEVGCLCTEAKEADHRLVQAAIELDSDECVPVPYDNARSPDAIVDLNVYPVSDRESVSRNFQHASTDGHVRQYRTELVTARTAFNAVT